MKKYIMAILNILMFSLMYIIVQVAVILVEVLFVVISILSSTSSANKPSSVEVLSAVQSGITDNTNLILLISMLITFSIYILIFVIKKKIYLKK